MPKPGTEEAKGFNIKCQITSFMRPNVKSLDVELQTNMYDCGLHALDMTTELAYGFDPAVCLHGIAST